MPNNRTSLDISFLNNFQWVLTLIGDLYDMSTSTRSHFYPITHDEKKEQKTKEKRK